MVMISGGQFLMGSAEPDAYLADGESPIRPVTVSSFWLDRLAVSNHAFEEFVKRADYLTDAERYGWSYVFAGLLAGASLDAESSSIAPWWLRVPGADWRHPEGPGSDIRGRLSHPAVHVTWQDAMAYCRWAKKRLPTEAEWEYAARGGLEQRRFPWGDDLEPNGEHRMNVWQGQFPSLNTMEDGYYGTAPVDAFPPNRFGLFNMTGNVWEWCADWFQTSFSPAPCRNPKGPRGGTHRIMRGGSYLCHASFSHRYRVSARSGVTPETSTGSLGFRCARHA
jgi:sulfatase modifying factor 1